MSKNKQNINEKSEKCKNQTREFKLRMSFNVPFASGRVGWITTRVPSQISRLRVAHSDSHSCIWPKSPCYFSMSHTGPATRLTLPPLLYNSTAPRATVRPPRSSFDSEIQRREVGLRVFLDEDHAVHARTQPVFSACGCRLALASRLRGESTLCRLRLDVLSAAPGC